MEQEDGSETKLYSDVSLNNSYFDEKEFKWRTALFREDGHEDENVTVQDVNVLFLGEEMSKERLERMNTYDNWYQTNLKEIIGKSFDNQWNDICDKYHLDVSKYNTNDFSDEVYDEMAIYKSTGDFDVSVLE